MCRRKTGIDQGRAPPNAHASGLSNGDVLGLACYVAKPTGCLRCAGNFVDKNLMTALGAGAMLQPKPLASPVESNSEQTSEGVVAANSQWIPGGVVSLNRKA